MNLSSKRQWSNPEDEQWGREFAESLASMPGISSDLASEALHDAQLASEESGCRASELFGSPVTFAEQIRRERVPVEIRAGVGNDGITARDRLKVLLTATGLTGASLSIGLFIVSGWSFLLTPSGLSLAVGGTVALVGALFGFQQRYAGHVRWGWTWWLAGLVGLVSSAVFAATVSDHTALLLLPTLLPFLVSLVALIISEALSYSPKPVATFSDQAPEIWFNQLAGILRGRYQLSRIETQHQVAEAQNFWHDSGCSHPYDEFGSPEVYALEILEVSDKPRRASQHREALLYSIIALTCVFLAVDTLGASGFTWSSLFPLGAIGLFGTLAIRTLQK